MSDRTFTCRCRFDPAYHREFNQTRSGEPIDHCLNPADPDTGYPLAVLRSFATICAQEARERQDVINMGRWLDVIHLLDEHAAGDSA